MGRRIYITEKQLKEALLLNETINQTIDKKPGESIDTAIKTAAKEVAAEAPTADVNFVIPKEEVTESIEGSSVEDVVSYIMSNNLLDNKMNLGQVREMVCNAYLNVTGEELENPEDFRNIMHSLSQYTFNSRNESRIYTKKQIKEAVLKKQKK